MLSSQSIRRSLRRHDVFGLGRFQHEVIDLTANLVQLVLANVKVAIVGTSTLITDSDWHEWALRINCDVLHLVFALLLDLQNQRLVAEALRLIISEVVEIYAALLDYLNKLNNSRVVVVRAGLDEGWFDIFGLFRHDGVHA